MALIFVVIPAVKPHHFYVSVLLLNAYFQFFLLCNILTTLLLRILTFVNNFKFHTWNTEESL